MLNTKAQAKSMNMDYSQTSLSFAARNGHKAVVKLLLNAKADVNSIDGYSRTVLSWAAGNGHEAVVRLLLGAGAKVDADPKDRGGTALSWAAGNGQETVVRLLLGAGAEVDAKDNASRRQSCGAAKSGHEARGEEGSVEKLCEAKDDINWKGNKRQT